MVRLLLSDVKCRICDIFRKYGVSETYLNLLSDSFCYSHLMGKHEHGVGRISVFLDKIQKGTLNINSAYNIIKDFNAISVIDADNGFGQVAMEKAVKIAIDKAKQFGISSVSVRNSNNFGSAGFFLKDIIKSDMGGIVMTNSYPSITIKGLSTPLIGTNPIAFGFPHSFVFDSSCSVVSKNRVIMAKMNRQSIPYGWAVDCIGNDTNNPVEALQGALLSIGDYKGIGLGLSISILTGILSGSGEVHNFAKTKLNSNCGHMVIVFDIKRFLNIDEYKRMMDSLLDSVVDKSLGKYHIPGNEYFKRLSFEYIDIPENIYNDFCTLENGGNKR